MNHKRPSAAAMKPSRSIVGTMVDGGVWKVDVRLGPPTTTQSKGRLLVRLCNASLPPRDHRMEPGTTSSASIAGSSLTTNLYLTGFLFGRTCPGSGLILPTARSAAKRLPVGAGVTVVNSPRITGTALPLAISNFQSGAELRSESSPGLVESALPVGLSP